MTTRPPPPSYPNAPDLPPPPRARPRSALPPPKGSVLFSPLRINRIELANRLWLPAMVTWLSNEAGEVTEAVQERYLRYAKGEVGMIVMEAMGIRDIRSGPLLRIGHDRYIPGLRTLVKRIHDRSPSKIMPQIIDFLKIAARDPTRYLRRLLPRYPEHPDLLSYSEAQLESVLSPREFHEYRYGYRQRIEDLSIEDVRKLPGLFARAAARARRAGFDGVELHFAHAYTVASFLSRRNARRDGYGGQSLHTRVRLAREIVEAVRREVGTDYMVGARILGREDIEGGSDVEDACFFARELATAGLDVLSISRGGKFEDAKQPKIGRAAYPYTGHSGLMCMPTKAFPEAYSAWPARRIREALRGAGLDTPVVVAGRINTYPMAETLLEEGFADLIGMARGLLADPDWPRKVREGIEPIHYCRYNNVCEALDRNHLPVRCQLWMKRPDGGMQAPEDW